MSTAPVAPMDEVTRLKTITAWAEAKAAMKAAAETEMALRKVLVNESGMFNPNKVEGTENYKLQAGWSLKSTKKQNYKIENKQGEAFAVLHQLSQMQPDVAEWQELVKELFSFDANLRKTQFDKLRGEERKLIEDILTITDGAPSLELISPKDVA